MSSSSDSAFEFFWRQRGINAFDVDDAVAERVKRERQQRRDLFSSAQLQNPYTTAKGDFPIVTLAPMQQKGVFQRLAEIANAEDSAIPDGSWPDLVDLTVNEQGNINALIDEHGGAFPEGEDPRERLTDEDARSIEQNRAVEEILRWCDNLDDQGVDGASLMSLLVADESGPVVNEARSAGVDVDELDRTLQDIEEAFTRNLVIRGIEECRDRLEGPTTERQLTEDEVLGRLRENFDVGAATDFASAIENIQQQIEQAEQTGEQRVLNRLQRSFGARFEDVDDAISSLQDRIERGRGPTVRSAPIEARRQAGEARIRIASDAAVFSQFRANVRREARRQLQLGNLPRTWREIGTIRLENEQLADIDLSPGRDLLGGVEGEDPFEPQPAEPDEDEQAELPEPETPAEQVADDLLESLSRE